MNDRENESRKGLACILSVFIIWGILPAYWKLIRKTDPILILSHRDLWAFVLLVILLVLFYKPRNLPAALKERRNIILFILAAASLFSQWFFYILTIITGHILELSLGYYIYPIIVVVLSRLFFREKMNRFTAAAFLLALTGVLILIIGYHSIPVYGLGIALSFALYSTVKKKLRAESIVSTFYEMLFLLPFALGYILYRAAAGSGAPAASGETAGTLMLLIGGGVLTCVTLLLFTSGARRISFTAVGFLQYISPTMALILAVAVYKESFGPGEWISFGFVWIAVTVYSLPAIRAAVQQK